MEHCPLCKKLVNALRSVSERKEKRDGKVVIVMWTSYQCASCKRTIRSEESERDLAEPACLG